MKNTKSPLLMATALLFILSITSCTKKQGCTDVDAINYDASAEENDGSCEYDGMAVFWKQSGDGLGTIVIVMDDGNSGTITGDKSSQPDCVDAGCFTYIAPPGVYGYSAIDQSTGIQWNNTVTITSQGCEKRLLTY